MLLCHGEEIKVLKIFEFVEVYVGKIDFDFIYFTRKEKSLNSLSKKILIQFMIILILFTMISFIHWGGGVGNPSRFWLSFLLGII
jgi:hypothetical protein